MHISACHLTRQAREVSGMDASPIGETLEDGDAADIADMMEASGISNCIYPGHLS